MDNVSLKLFIAPSTRLAIEIARYGIKKRLTEDGKRLKERKREVSGLWLL